MLNVREHSTATSPEKATPRRAGERCDVVEITVRNERTAAPSIVGVSASASHSIRKAPVAVLHVRAGYGVAGDAHFGTTVKHRYDVQRDPQRPNRRQVHLIGAELFDDLAGQGFDIEPGELGENVTTRGLDLVRLPLGTRMRIGSTAVLEVTGLRNPCSLLDRVHPGSRAAASTVFDGMTILNHAIMAIVVADGEIRAGDAIAIDLPAPPHARLKTV